MATNPPGYNRAYYEARLAAGLCTQCGEPRGGDRKDKIACAICARASVDRSLRLRAELIANGKCENCREPNDRPGMTRCSECANKSICGLCHKTPVDPDVQRSCDSCKARRNAIAAARRAAGICVYGKCGRHTNGKTRCREHLRARVEIAARKCKCGGHKEPAAECCAACAAADALNLGKEAARVLMILRELGGSGTVESLVMEARTNKRTKLASVERRVRRGLALLRSAGWVTTADMEHDGTHGGYGVQAVYIVLGQPKPSLISAIPDPQLPDVTRRARMADVE